MSRDSIRTELRGLDAWITREPPDEWDEADDEPEPEQVPGPKDIIEMAINEAISVIGTSLFSVVSGRRRRHALYTLAEASRALRQLEDRR